MRTGYVLYRALVSYVKLDHTLYLINYGISFKFTTCMWIGLL